MEHTITHITVIILLFLALAELSRFCISARYPRIKPIPVPARDPSAITMRIENASVITSDPPSCDYLFFDIKRRISFIQSRVFHTFLCFDKKPFRTTFVREY